MSCEQAAAEIRGLVFVLAEEELLGVKSKTVQLNWCKKVLDDSKKVRDIGNLLRYHTAEHLQKMCDVTDELAKEKVRRRINYKAEVHGILPSSTC